MVWQRNKILSLWALNNISQVSSESGWFRNIFQLRRENSYLKSDLEVMSFSFYYIKSPWYINILVNNNGFNFWMIFWRFPTLPLSKLWLRFSKSCRRATQMFPNISKNLQGLPKISKHKIAEDYWRRPRKIWGCFDRTPTELFTV